jgi:pimeloyl-ACP methyl ester carboxylesterase
VGDAAEHAVGSTQQRTVYLRGCHLAYRVRGSGPPVLFIQGTGLHGDGWRPQVDELYSHFTCVTFDNRGMGASLPCGCPITVAQMAEDARVVLDAAGIDSAHVVGHSLGGLVALHLALSERPRVRSLSLLCTFANGRDATKLSLAMLSIGLRTRIGTRAQRRRAFLQLVMTPTAWAATDSEAMAAELAPLFGHDLADHPAIEMAQLRAMRKYDATPRLSELATLPTLVVTAAHDLIAPPALGIGLANSIPGARHHHFAAAAHGLPLQRATEVNALLSTHWRDVDDRVPQLRCC